MKTIHILATVATVTCLSAPQALAKRVTVEFEAEAGTVTGQPFGMTVPRLTIVRGYFSYETNTPDTFSNSADTMRGSFVLAGTWDFRAEFLDRVIKGSGTATSSTNLFGSPTLRFKDGLGNNRPELMTIDGVPDATIGLGFAISGHARFVSLSCQVHKSCSIALSVRKSSCQRRWRGSIADLTPAW